jgi:hypothetical protein
MGVCSAITQALWYNTKVDDQFRTMIFRASSERGALVGGVVDGAAICGIPLAPTLSATRPAIGHFQEIQDDH